MSSNDLIQSRIAKMNKLKELGVNPFPSISIEKEFVKEIRNFEEGREVQTCGRLMSYREHGKISFADLHDETGRIQLAFRRDVIGEKVYDEYIKLLDLGDFVRVKGKIFVTKAGEKTIDTAEIELLTKSLRPLPSSWYGLKDAEERFRQRYVDFNLEPELREMFKKKTIFWATIRNFMISKGFLEVETPVLENTAGGADANPFVTHHNALDINVFLRISMGELWQKRLMVAGFERTFEIGRQFRNEGISREHLQDYTQMEFYWAYANYEDSMKLVEEMYKKVAIEAFGTYEFEINGHKVDMGKKWERLSYGKAIKEAHGIDIDNDSDEVMRAKLKSLKIPFEKNDERGRLIDLLWKEVRKGVSGPVFLVDHPVEVSPLAKRKKDNSKLVERYQVILAGSEMGNGYSELNDPIDQAQRFKKQQDMRDNGDDEAQMYDRDFVRALEYGMPPVTGFGVSERLFSFLANKPVSECVMFPLLRPEENIENIDESLYS
jgi:lysyl-tRNA synthetase class 2